MSWKTKKEQDAYNLVYREKNRAILRQKARDHRNARQALVNSLKSKPCADCGGCFPPECMDFDHRPGTGKKWGIGTCVARYTLDALFEEIAKCDIVCANCHRIRTKQAWREGRLKGNRK